MKFVNRRDAVIITVITLALLFIVIFVAMRDDGAVAVVEYNGERIARYDLSGEQQQLELPQNPEVVLSYGEEGAFFVHSDCNDQVCVNTGIIHKSGEMAACLPNGVIIYVEGKGDTAVVIG